MSEEGEAMKDAEEKTSLTWFTVTDDQNIFNLPEGTTITFTPNISPADDGPVDVP